MGSIISIKGDILKNINNIHEGQVKLYEQKLISPEDSLIINTNLIDSRVPWIEEQT